MTNNQNRNMQEALDANLEPEAYRKLLNDMESNPEASADYKKLQSAEGMLREARTRPAPGSIMDGIMARIAEPETLPAPAPLISGRALAFGLGLTAVVALPLLTALSLLILLAFGTGSAISGFAVGVFGIVMFLYTLLIGSVNATRELILSYPLILALLLLIPMAWFGLWRLGRSWSRVEQ